VEGGSVEENSVGSRRNVSLLQPTSVSGCLFWVETDFLTVRDEMVTLGAGGVVVSYTTIDAYSRKDSLEHGKRKQPTHGGRVTSRALNRWA